MGRKENEDLGGSMMGYKLKRGCEEGLVSMEMGNELMVVNMVMGMVGIKVEVMS